MSTQRDEIAAAVRGQTVVSRFIETVEARPDATAIRWREEPGFASWTWREYAERAARFAGALRDLGIPRGRGVLISLRNRPERYVVETGVLLHGGITVAADDRQLYLAEQCDAAALVIDDPAACEQFLRASSQLPHRCQVVLLAAPGVPVPDGAVGYDEAMKARPVDLREAAAGIRPDDAMNFLYTSGTTGPPKGSIATHAHICWWAESIRRVIPDYPLAGKRIIAYLPMSIMAVRLVQYYLHAIRGTEMTTCAEPQRLAEYMAQVRPNIFLGVPLIWQRMYARIRAGLVGDPERERHFAAALEIGRQVEALRSAAAPLPPELSAAWERVDAGVFRPLRESMGLDHCDIALSGTAPTSPTIVDFFTALGVPLSESYGLAEVTAITFEPFRRRIGTAGRAIPGCELRLLADGEILLRSGNLCNGYHNAPERTAETFDAEGWFHTGDIGEIDGDGYVKIIGRKKELIIFADGSNVPPVNLEEALKGASPLIDQVCVIGDNRLYIVALVVLNPEVTAAWARAHGLEAQDLNQLARAPEIRHEIERCVARVNQTLARHEQIRRFVLLADSWAPGSKLVNAAAKLVREAIHEHYAAEIDAMYQEEA